MTRRKRNRWGVWSEALGRFIPLADRLCRGHPEATDQVIAQRLCGEKVPDDNLGEAALASVNINYYTALKCVPRVIETSGDEDEYEDDAYGQKDGLF